MMGRFVANFLRGFFIARRRSIASRRAIKNSLKKFATKPPSYMCVHLLRKRQTTNDKLKKMEKTHSRISLSNVCRETQKLRRQNANVFRTRGVRCLLSHVIVEFPNSRHVYAYLFFRKRYELIKFLYQGHGKSVKRLYVCNCSVIVTSNRQFMLI